MSTSEEVQVDFTVECDEFAVPEWTDLECSAKFNVYGYVELDDSGPVKTSMPSVMLLDPTEYTIAFNGEPLPEWLQYRLATEDGHLFDEAFLEAIGGQAKLDELAVEKALGL